MQAERWQQLDQLFHSALQLEPGERAALLDKECAGDEGLRRECEALLAAHEEAGSFIEKPALDVEACSVAADQTQLSAGQTISHYRIVSLLGAGGMGEVYLAEDTTLGRKVALKLLPIDFTRDLDRVRRFQQEAHAASALNHPNIITIHEIAQVEDRHLIATEFIDGETLRERIRGSRSQTSEDGSEKVITALPIREVLDIGIQIADALAAAHEAGIVHRDIKPENIMVRRRDGYIKVLDFGLAKLSEPPAVAGGYNVDTEAVTRAQVKTSAGLVMGTVSYMSPEQTRGEKVDQRTDIWSLGVVLYELVAGRAPFDRRTPSEIIAAILDHDPRPLSDYVGETFELQRIITKALTKDRTQRYQIAKDLLVDLRQLQHQLELGEVIDRSSSSDSGAVKATRIKRQKNSTRASGESVVRQVRRHRRGLFLFTIAAAGVVLVIGTLIYRSHLFTGGKAIDSIAVLPFVNASGDSENEYLSDGITESIINNLSQLPQLKKVKAFATVFRFKGKDIDPQKVGTDLGVQAVLTGRLFRQGERVVIRAELVNVADGAQLWNTEYNRNVAEVLFVQQDMSRQISEKLRLKLTGEEKKRLTEGDTTNPEAYQRYLRGRLFLNQGTAEGLKKARTEFQQAIDLDPNYALAYVGLSASFSSSSSGTPSSEIEPLARAAVERALQLDYSLAEAHAALGFLELSSWNFVAAEREFKQAIELNPENPTAHVNYGFYLGLVRGRFDDAMAELRRAQQLDPSSVRIRNTIAIILIAMDELDEAKRVLELDLNFPNAHRLLAIVYRKQGRYEDALAESEKGLELSGREARFLTGLGLCYAVAGKREKAREVLRELEEQYSQHKALGHQIANVYAALGEKERAFAWLEKDLEARTSSLATILYAPGSDILRNALSSDPRWNDLLRRVGILQN